jgi:hypothetical protein
MQNQKRDVGQQLDLPIEARPESRTHTPRPNSLIANSAENGTTLVSGNQPWYKISRAVAVAVLFLIIVASVGFDQPNTSVPENFRRQDSSPATPIARNFPDTEFPAPGAKLQLGIFSKLQGAESMLTKLSSLGLTPHIEKRLDVTGTRYAIVLGPLDQKGHSQILRKLKESDLNYFQTEWLSTDYSTGSGS